VQRQGLLDTLGRLWQGLQQLDSSGAVADGFHIGRALAGLLGRPQPVDDRLLVVARRSVVLGYQLRLGLGQRRELRFEDLGNLLVDVLSGALEQRRIGRVLNQGVLKHIPGPRRPSSLVEEFGCH
jgi:hypothetical protein